ncbi:MAG: hypothetical protein OXC01_13220 [Immundisolibacterales bacterium]|nr:hypothetical protein [Immundisolibacterales bacterium]
MSAPSPLRAPPPVRFYAFVVFAAAWLVFWVQPLAVRGILPVLGGSAAVWNTAMVFFQSALLAGYALAHFLVRRASPRAQLAILAALWGCAALTAPVGGLRPFGEAPGALPPVLWLLGTLAGALGLAFVAAATLTPLVQAWLARCGAGAASRDPYFLYAASNAGSAGALLAYPFLIEPFVGLERQAWLWSAALLVLAPFLFVLWRALPGSRAAAPLAAAAPFPEPRHPEPLAVGRILALSAVPSALLLGVTQYLATDLASVPLLWTVPLALYLGTFVHAFARRQLVPLHLLARLIPLVLIALAILFTLTRTVLAFGLVHLLVFTAAALYCHGALAGLRPPTAGLTRFYLLLSAGGLTGGLLVALAAPLVFADVYEYPIALAAVAAFLPPATFAFRRRHLLVAAAALACVVGGLVTAAEVFEGFDDGLPLLVAGMFALVALAAPALLVLRAKPFLLAGALVAVFLAPSGISLHTEEVVARERTFFGVYRVIESGGKRSFYHGTTMHGAEWPRPDGSIESRTTYYGPETPFGDLLRALVRRPSPLVIGLAGLGTGSLACYARPGDEVRIYEIDPVVVDLARKHFAALRDCAPEARVAIGDARLLIERERASLDILTLDTFSSDAIPVHMLTEEAFESYLRVLAEDGILAVHISNRHLDLEPVLAALADRLGLAGRIKRYESAETDESPPRGSESSVVTVLARDEATLGSLDLDAGWVPLGSPDRVRAWTDDYTSIVPLLYWR